jgi:hypothetical protein
MPRRFLQGFSVWLPPHTTDRKRTTQRTQQRRPLTCIGTAHGTGGRIGRFASSAGILIATPILLASAAPLFSNACPITTRRQMPASRSFSRARRSSEAWVPQGAADHVRLY